MRGPPIPCYRQKITVAHDTLINSNKGKMDIQKWIEFEINELRKDEILRVHKDDPM